MNSIPDVPEKERRCGTCSGHRDHSCVRGFNHAMPWHRPHGTDGYCWSESRSNLRARAEKIIAGKDEALKKAEAKVKLLMADLRRWEEESACLPEDRSIGEVVEHLRKQVKLLREALEAMLEPQDEECWYDHHGHCQAHHMRINDAGDPECEVPLARKALAETEDKGEKA